jgi:FxLD family lantipeptide
MAPTAQDVQTLPTTTAPGDDPFALELVVVTEGGTDMLDVACGTSDGCGSSCASACTSLI